MADATGMLEFQLKIINVAINNWIFAFINIFLDEQIRDGSVVEGRNKKQMVKIGFMCVLIATILLFIPKTAP